MTERATAVPASERDLRLALLTWNYPPVPTGIGRAAEAIAEGLAEAGLDVCVFSADRPAGQRERSGGATVIGCAVPPHGALGLMRRRAALGHLAAPLAFRAAVLAEHAVAPFDIVETTNWYAPAALLPRLANASGAAPLIVRHSTPAVKTAGPDLGPRDRIDLAFAHALERRLVLRADLSIFNTRASEAILAPLYRVPAQMQRAVIGLALPDDTIRTGAAAPWPGPDAPLTLAFVGRAERRKGFDELIAAFAAVRAALPGRSPRLHLVGTDPGDETLAAVRLGLPPEVGSAIVNHGRVDDGAMHAVLASAHMVVAPSRTESYGIFYREAAAFGRPLVAAADDASAREFIGDTGAGVLAQTCAPDAIAAAILRVSQDADLAAGCRSAGLIHARTLTRAALAAATRTAYDVALQARIASRT